MASNKIVRFGPVALSTSVSNILSAPAISGGIGLAGTSTSTYLIVRHLRIVNTAAAAASPSLFIGPSGGSSSANAFAVNGTSIPASGNPSNYLDWYGGARMDVGDFLTGLGSVAGLVIQGEIEIGIA